MLPEFSTEPRELPWQPKLCKNKPKFHTFQFCKSYGDNVCVYGRIFRVVEFKYANKKELPQQPNLHKKAKNAQISVLYAI